MRVVRITAIAFLALLVVWAAWLRFGYRVRSGVAAELEARARIGVGIQVRLTELTDFQWERAIFLGPYSTQEMANKALGFDWPEYPRFGLEMSDSFSLLVFAVPKRVVRTEKIRRCLPDFDKALLAVGVPRDAATFTIEDRRGCSVLVWIGTQRSNSAFNPDVQKPRAG